MIYACQKIKSFFINSKNNSNDKSKECLMIFNYNYKKKQAIC